MQELNEEELEAAGVPLACDCGTDLTHYVTKTEVHIECSGCGFEDVEPIYGLY